MGILDQFSAIAEKYIATVGENPVFPRKGSIKKLQQLNEPLQENPVPAEEVLKLLDPRVHREL